MEFTEAVRSRRMTRHFDPDRPVPRDVLSMLLRLAIRAPSAGHTQGWLFLVLDDITSRSRFWTATSTGPPDSWRRGMEHAPAIVVCFSDQRAYLDRYAEPDKGWTDRDPLSWPIPYWHVDVGMAAVILLLGAQDVGLGGCFFGVPARGWQQLRHDFGIDSRLTPVGAVALGYAAPVTRSRPLRRSRREFDDVVQFAADEPGGGQSASGGSASG